MKYVVFGPTVGAKNMYEKWIKSESCKTQQYQTRPQYQYQYGNQCQHQQNMFTRGPMNVDRYKKMDFIGIFGYQNPISDELRKAIPKFSRNGEVLREDHIRSFQNTLDDFDVQEEDVFIKIFMQSLTEDARDWCKSLPDSSIHSWEEFKRIFIEQYESYVDPKFSLHEITNIQKGYNETISNFNMNFTKFLNKLPLNLKPNDSTSLMFYINSFDPKTRYELRIINPPILIEAYKDAIIIESNRKAFGKIVRRDDARLYNPKTQNKQPKEEDKMNKVINNLKDITHKVKKNDRPQFQTNDRPRLQDMLYRTNWKDGKLVDEKKETLDPLKKKNNHR